MKKINTTKLMALLASACLITSSFVGSTLAKYTTQADANDTARVAKWGVVLQADGNLYGNDYIDAIDLSDDAATLAVQASDDKDVVAPGTKNVTGLNFAVNGTPEVATALTATITAENIFLKNGTYAVMVEAPNVTADSFKLNTYYTKANNAYTLATAYTDSGIYYTKTDDAVVANTYYPVVYTASDYNSGDQETDSINAIAALYAKQLNNGTAVVGVLDADTNVTTYTITKKEYAPNFDYSSLKVEGENLTWAWDFQKTAIGKNDETYNEEDTILGNLMAGTLADAEVVKFDGTSSSYVLPVNEEDYNLTTTFTIDITVEQVDKQVGAN